MLNINKPKLEGEIEVKRFYLTGIEMSSPCPKCGKIATWDGNQNYVYYPNLDESQYVPFYCDDCDKEWEEFFKMSVTLEPVNK